MKSSLKSLVLLASSLLALSPLQAQVFYTWTNGANNGQFSNAGNWTPSGGPPGPNDEASIGIAANVFLPSGSDTIELLELENSPISLTGTNTTSFTTDLFGVFENASGTISLQGGTSFTATSDDNIIGAGTTSEGLGSGTLTITGTGTVAFSSTFQSLFIGSGATGVVNQTGGTVTAAGTIFVGSDGDVSGFSSTTGTGVYTISGTSTLTIAAMDLGAGSSATAATSSGTLNVMSGIVTITDTVALGISSVSTTGTVNGDTGVIQQSGGVLNAVTVQIGESTGGIGSYTLSGSGTLSATDVVIGDNTGASGTFTQSSGTGTITDFTVGESGTGTYNLQGGNLTISTTGNLTIGDQAGSVGSVTQSGGTLTLADITTTLNVGNDGTGSYNLSGGELIDNGELNIGNGTGTGTFTLSGGGDLVAAPGVNVGGGSGTGVFNYEGGTIDPTTTIFVNSNGTFNQYANFTPGTGNPLNLEAGAVYNLNSGTLTIGGTMMGGGTSGIDANAAAILNFAGGSVATSSAWQDQLSGAVTGNNTIDTTLGSATLTGTITGSGTFTVIGGGSLVLNGVQTTNASSWGINVQNGTVSADSLTLPGNINIGSAGTVDLTNTGFRVLNGTLTGTGLLAVTFNVNTSTLELTNTVNFTGEANLNGNDGTLQVFNGTLGTITGDGNLDVGSTSGTGSLNLAGAFTSTGSVTVNPGYTLTGSSFTGGGLITNNGSLGVSGAAGSTLSTTGGLISTGTLVIRMTGDSGDPTDVIHIGTTGTLSGSVELLTPAGSGTFTIVSTNAANDLTDNGLAIANNTGRLFQASLVDVNNQDIDLVTNTSTIASLGINLTPNQSSVGTALDNAIGNQGNLPANQLQNLSQLLLLVAPSGISNSQLAQNLEQLTPESLQYSQAIAYEHSAFLVNKVDSFDNALHHEFSGFDDSAINLHMPGFDSGLGQQMQSLLAFDPPSFHQTAPNGVNYYPDGQSTLPASDTTDSPSSPEPSNQVISDSPQPMPLLAAPNNSVALRKPYSNFSEFVGGDGTIANLNQDQGASNAPSTKASYSSEDAIGGISYRMTSNLAAGILFDYSHTDATTDSYGSKTRVDSYSPGAFATFADKGFYVNGLFAYGRNNYSNNRVIPVVGSTASSNPDGNQYTGALDAGYEFHPARDWTLTPAGGLTYTHLDVDSFTETGAAPANLNVDAQHDDSLRSRLGGYLTWQVHPGQLTLIPNFSAMWQHEFLDENAPITSQFNDFSSGAFTIHSASMGRDSALIGVGLTAQLDNSMAIFFDCTADVNGDYNAEDFIGGFKGSF